MDDVLTDDEVLVITEARRVIARIRNRTDHMGRLAETADHAEQSLFRILNVASSYYGVDLTYEQIHDRPDPTAQQVAS